MKRITSSILDIVKDTLPPDVWDGVEGDLEGIILKADLKSQIIEAAESLVEGSQHTIKGVHLKGGAATQQWKEDSDIDISITLNWADTDPKVVEEFQTQTSEKCDFFWGDRPVTLFIKSPDQIHEASDSIWDVLMDEWVVKPMWMPPGFDPEEYLKPYIEVAETEARLIDLILGDCKRTVNSLNKYKKSDDPESVNKANNLAIEVKLYTMRLNSVYVRVKTAREALHRNLAERIENGSQITVFDRLQQPEITYKYLEQTGYKEILKKIHQTCKELESDSCDNHSTQIDLEPDLTNSILSQIKDDCIYNDEPGFGKEKDVHITVLYGVVNDTDFFRLKSICENFEPFEITLGDISTFSSEKYDVLKIEVISDKLVELHNKFKVVDNVWTHPEYNPHITLAYVKKGSCDNLLGPCSLTGKTIRVPEVKWSDKGKFKLTMLLGKA